MLKAIGRFLIVLAVCAGTAGALAGILIDTVIVGDPGNAAYTGYGGHGAVAYVYDIGKYEVTAGQYAEFLNAVATTDTYGLYNERMDVDSGIVNAEYGCNIKRSGSPGSYAYSVAPDWANRPVNNVSWGDAARFCNWMHNGQPTGPQGLGTTEDGSYFLDGATTDAQLNTAERQLDATWAIPTLNEWHKAAYYKGGGTDAGYWEYPTSSDTEPGYVTDSGNLSGTDVPFMEGGTDLGNYATYDGDSGTYGVGSPYYRTQAGEWENSSGPYGTFDQGGNVAEWNEPDWPAEIYHPHRGGRFSQSAWPLRVSNYHSTNPTVELFDLGFRVALVPEPGTMTLLALAGLGIVRRR